MIADKTTIAFLNALDNRNYYLIMQNPSYLRFLLDHISHTVTSFDI